MVLYYYILCLSFNLYYLWLGTKHGHINSLDKTYKDEELLKLRTEISGRVYKDRATSLDTPHFRTCIVEFREEFFRASKLLLSSVPKGDGKISSDILRRRSMETDMERRYRERVEREGGGGGRLLVSHVRLIVNRVLGLDCIVMHGL